MITSNEILWDDNMQSYDTNTPLNPIDFEEYKTGDVICCFKNGEKKKIIARKIVVDKTKQITLLPINNEYNPEIVSLDDIVIMGKVKKVISTIQ